MSRRPDIHTWLRLLLLAGMLNGTARVAAIEADPVPPEVDDLYRRGLEYLVSSQTETGAWPDSWGHQPAVVGLGVLAILAHGDDPNYGPYSDSVHRGIDFLTASQNSLDGHLGGSMYNHGFATLALAEAYGTVDDRRIEPVLRRAIELLLASQAQNPTGAWRYSPQSSDADTTVSGACLVALLAARNAGFGVPDHAVRRALSFYEHCQGSDGGFGYTAPGSTSPPRTAIGVVVYSLADRQSSPVYRRAYRRLLANPHPEMRNHHFYFLYYASQAVFQGNPTDWRTWNERNIARLAALQEADGRWRSDYGSTFGTATALLSLALNYRFLPIYER